MGKNINFLKRLFCKHKNREMLRWHYTHGYNGMEPSFIEIEYRCNDCEKIFYRALHNNMKEFAKKHENKRY